MFNPRERAPITWQIGARRTNHDREFCYRYGYKHNIKPLRISSSVSTKVRFIKETSSFGAIFKSFILYCKCFGRLKFRSAKGIPQYWQTELTRVSTAPGLRARISLTVWNTSTVCSVLTRSINDIMADKQPLRPTPSLCKEKQKLQLRIWGKTCFETL